MLKISAPQLLCATIRAYLTVSLIFQAEQRIDILAEKAYFTDDDHCDRDYTYPDILLLG